MNIYQFSINFHKIYFEKIVPRGTFSYLPRYNRSILTSDGETPLILPACPIVTGFILDNFCLPSVEIDNSSV